MYKRQEIDDYAIPDEPGSYASNRDYVSAKGMTPQETADEDRMVTQAEYDAEIEAETSEKDPSELQYITPIDYAKRIAEPVSYTHLLRIYIPDTLTRLC